MALPLKEHMYESRRIKIPAALKMHRCGQEQMRLQKQTGPYHPGLKPGNLNPVLKGKDCRGRIATDLPLGKKPSRRYEDASGNSLEVQVVRPQCFHWCGPGSVPGQGTWIAQPQSGVEKKLHPDGEEAPSS